MKKKVLSLVLAALMLTPLMAGCTTLEADDKGAIIDMYLGTEVYDFDPQLSITDDAQLRYMRLMFEGLTRINEKGKWENALMKSYKIEQDNEEGFSILVTLNSTRWSDGRTVQAADFVYAWKRLLDPDQKHEAASLLYDIKNAKAAKMGDVSIDDIGIAAVDTYVLQIKFEQKLDLDNFFEKLSSISLVPLREDVITRYGETWARKTTSIVVNGPFIPKEITAGSVIRLERSTYYYMKPTNKKSSTTKEEALDKYVIPYRLLNDYSRGNAAAQYDAFASDSEILFYDGDIALEDRAAVEKDAVVTDMMATHTYVFNTNNKLFAKAEVRRALSMALDREEIVRIVTFAKPATGYVPYKVFDTKSGTSFRETGGALLSTTANEAEAKKLLQSAGVTSGSFTISIRENEVDMAVAEYVKGVWEKLGFSVSIETLRTSRNAAAETVNDKFQDAYEAGDFDVIGIDTMMLSSDPFAALAPFATAYSGNGVDMNSANYDLYGHISGYHNDAYDALLDTAYNTVDLAERAAALHDAEKMLLEDMPVCPLFFLQDAYVVSSELSGMTTDYYAVRSFNRTKLHDYMTYKAATETVEETKNDSESNADTAG